MTIVPDPGYQAYLGGTVLAGGEPYIVPLRPENDFLVPLDSIPAEVAKRAKILYLNYPNNPTAAIAPREYLQECVDWCRANDVILAYDNAYVDLSPVVRGLAESSGREVRWRFDGGDLPGGRANYWVVLTNNRAFLDDPAVQAALQVWPADAREAIHWTDDYSNLYSILTIR